MGAIHVGFAMSRIDEAEAAETLRILRSFAVSAMKCTPAMTITRASPLAASRASARLSPTTSATQWKISGDW